MQNLKLKTIKMKSFALIIIALLMASATLMAMTVDAATTNNHDVWSEPLPAGVTPDFTQPTIAHLSFTPDVIGVGQSLLVNMWISPNPHGARAFKEYDVIFTKPDGTKDTVKVQSFMGDATSFISYIPDVAGAWTVEFDFPGGYFPAGNYTTPLGTTGGANITNNFLQSIYYSPSSDGPYNLTVQNDYVYSWPPAALPNDYWTRPINNRNREWGVISGWYPATGVYGGFDPYPNNWPADTNLYMSNYNYIPYVQGPNSAHILWKRLDSFASGIVGGPLGQYTAATSGSNPTLIYNGKCYQTVTKYYDGVATSVWQMYDLRTGEIYWEQVLPTGVTAPSWVISIKSSVVSDYTFATQAGQEGVYLANIVRATSTTDYRLIYRSPSTGAVSYNVSISPLTSGTFYMDSDYPYFLSVQNIGNTTVPNYRLINWTIFGDATTGYTYTTPTLRIMNNISCAFSSLYSTTDFDAGYTVTQYSYPPNNASGVVQNQGIRVYSLKTGQLVQNITTNIGTEHFQSSSSLCVDHGKVAVDFEDGRVHCWDCATGKYLWASEVPAYGEGWPWSDFYEYGVSSYGGNYLIGTYAGILAINWTNGNISWLYRSKAPANFESPYQGYNPFFTAVKEADGKVYGYSSEHTPSQPLTRSWGIHCCNATTGEEIWALMGGGSPGAIADGYLTTGGGDGYMYVIGKGQSATTVTAPDVSVPLGTAFTIKGTVLDMSPAQPGTPCVSKGSMQTQMEYLHMQQPVTGIFQNETAIGVPVHLLAMGSDGTYTDLGTVTTNGFYGTFSKAWTPTKEDTYQIIASFAADDSYGSSSAATAVTVSLAPVATATPTATPTSNLATAADLMTYIVAGVIAIIIAIAIVGVLILRKRP